MNQPVITLYDFYKPDGQPLFSPAQDRPTLFVTSNVIRNEVSIESLTACLWQESEGAICAGRFSYDKVKGEFRIFNQSELEDIQVASRSVASDEI